MLYLQCIVNIRLLGTGIRDANEFTNINSCYNLCITNYIERFIICPLLCSFNKLFYYCRGLLLLHAR